MAKRKLVILGSTGSIGRQTLQVLEEFRDSFQVVALTAFSNVDVMRCQIKKWNPESVCMVDREAAAILAGENLGPDVCSGSESLLRTVEEADADSVVVAVAGTVGIEATISALRSGKNIAIANKETLVSAGDLVMELARSRGLSIYPIDSEHSALWQCLAGEQAGAIEQLILTASGGPFYGCSYKDLMKITKKEALKHPTWNMGAKITIDSATLMNKGLEVIEAAVLFGMSADQIDVLVHPQSIVHSLVAFRDGAVKAQLGVPDMRQPIQYALFGGNRLANTLQRLDLASVGELKFDRPDTKVFRCLSLAYEALRIGGSMPAVLNAANELAVSKFLNDEIGFLDIPEIICHVMSKHDVIQCPTLEDIIEVQRWAVRVSAEWAAC